MTTKHTPAPWTWWDENTPTHPRPKGYDLARLSGNNGKTVITKYGGAGYLALGKTEEDIANAHLIAAAPELLEALEEILDDEFSDLRKSLEAKGRAAIAKAKGQDE